MSISSSNRMHSDSKNVAIRYKVLCFVIPCLDNLLTVEWCSLK